MAKVYRAVAARLNYISPDRPDIGFAVKEAARSMSKPKESDMHKLKKIARYLIGRPRLVLKFPWQHPPDRLVAFTDSDWAGCTRSAKSTSGGAICLGEHVLKTYCKQQKVIALSSAEAELYAMVAASAEVLAISAYAKDLGMTLDVEMYCDSAAALGITNRAGIGKVRHLRTQGLWVQEVRASGRIAYKKVLGEKNPADLLTKHLSNEVIQKHVETLNLEWRGGRADSAPTIDTVESYTQSWYEELQWDDVSLNAILESEASEHEEKVKIRGIIKMESTKRDGNKAKQVKFDRTVTVRPIPAAGKFRPTPTRGTSGMRARWIQEKGSEVLLVAQRGGDKRGVERKRCTCGGLTARGDGRRWADEEAQDCPECAKGWSTLNPTINRKQSNDDERPVDAVEMIIEGDQPTWMEMKRGACFSETLLRGRVRTSRRRQICTSVCFSVGGRLSHHMCCSRSTMRGMSPCNRDFCSSSGGGDLSSARERLNSTAAIPDHVQIGSTLRDAGCVEGGAKDFGHVYAHGSRKHANAWARSVCMHVQRDMGSGDMRASALIWAQAR